MQFNNITSNSGLLQDCEFTLFGDNGFGQITNNTSRLQAFTNLINRALDKVTSLIMKLDGRWQFDDTNYTDLPIGKTDLIAEQKIYNLAVYHLKILRVEVMDENGRTIKLEPIDINDIEPEGVDSLFTTSGLPRFYDIQAQNIVLYPAPNANSVTETAGLRVFYQRNMDYFTTTDTTKEAGFNPIFQRLVSRWASYDYAIARQLPIAKALRDEISILQTEMEDFYSSRNPDDRTKIIIKKTLWS